jgi:sugar (pentulose or hexulose) kinase
MEPWPQILAAATGIPAVGRRSGLAAAAGAALIGASAIGLDFDLDTIDPAMPQVVASTEMLERYKVLRRLNDKAVQAALSLAAASNDSGPAEQ